MLCCDRCHVPIVGFASRDQALCVPCCRHLRAGGAWALGSPTPAAARRSARCPVEFLPFRAGVLFGPVSLYPTSEDFHNAATLYDEAEPAAHWQIEAIRYRRLHPGAPLDEDALAVIAGHVEKRLAQARAETEA